MVKIIVNNHKCSISGLPDMALYKELDIMMSYENPGFEFAKTKNPRLQTWDGRVRLFDKKTFPVGLLKMVTGLLDKKNEKYTVEDLRDHSQGEELKIIDSKFMARDYQEEVVRVAMEQKSGVIRMCTGSGKTSVIAMIAAKFNVKTIVYVIGKELLFQMKETVERLLGIKCGIIGDGICDISEQINICTIWSAARAFDLKASILDSDVKPDKEISIENKIKIKKLVKEARMFILDECQYAGSSSLQMLSKLSESSRFRFLLSGTPWREMGDDILIEAVSGPKIYDLPATTLINRGILVPPKIYFINVPRKRVIGKTYNEVYSNYIVNNEERNNLIVYAAKDLIEKGRKVLILISKVEHGHILHDLLSDKYRVDSLNGSDSSDARMNAIKMMREGSLDVLIASKIFDQGIDIPELDALILAGSGKSSARALQRIGRVIRSYPSKKWANVIEFWDNAKYLDEHSKARLKIYRSEPAFQIKIQQSTISVQPEQKISHEISWEKNDRRRTISKNSKLDSR